MPSPHPIPSTIILLIIIALISLICTTPTEAFGDVVNRTFCPNRCSGIGECFNMTLSDETTQTYECDCKYQSQYIDCSDETRIPVIYSIILTCVVILMFVVTFFLFSMCNKEFDKRQRHHHPNSVLSR